MKYIHIKRLGWFSKDGRFKVLNGAISFGDGGESFSISSDESSENAAITYHSTEDGNVLEQSVYGRFQASDQRFSNLNVFGDVNLSEVEVLDNLNVYGALNVMNSLLSTVKVHGRVSLSNTKTKENIQVFGDINASDAYFGRNVQVYGRVNFKDVKVIETLSFVGDKANIKDSHLGSILVEKNSSEV